MSRHSIVWTLLGLVAVAGVVGIGVLRRTGTPSVDTPRTDGATAHSQDASARQADSRPKGLPAADKFAGSSEQQVAAPADAGATPEAAQSESSLNAAGGHARVGVSRPVAGNAAIARHTGEDRASGGVVAALPKEDRGTTVANRAARRTLGPRPQAAVGGPMYVSTRAPARTEAKRADGGADVSTNRQAAGQSAIAMDSGAGGTAPSTSAETSGGTASTPSGQKDATQGNAGDAVAAVEPERIVTPLDVVQLARRWQDDVMQVSFAVMLDGDTATVTPNGLIVCQQIPKGWEVVKAEPAVQAVDDANRIAKWLFVGNAVTNSSIYSLSMRPHTGTTGNWEEARAWYTYRQPDGQCREVAVIPYSGGNIQPGN